MRATIRRESADAERLSVIVLCCGKLYRASENVPAPRRGDTATLRAYQVRDMIGAVEDAWRGKRIRARDHEVEIATLEAGLRIAQDTGGVLARLGDYQAPVNNAEHERRKAKRRQVKAARKRNRRR